MVGLSNRILYSSENELRSHTLICMHQKCNIEILKNLRTYVIPFIQSLNQIIWKNQVTYCLELPMWALKLWRKAKEWLMDSGKAFFSAMDREDGAGQLSGASEVLPHCFLSRVVSREVFVLVFFKLCVYSVFILLYVYFTVKMLFKRVNGTWRYTNFCHGEQVLERGERVGLKDERGWPLMTVGAFSYCKGDGDSGYKFKGVCRLGDWRSWHRATKNLVNSQ